MSDRREVPARSDGKTLYLKTDPTGPELTYAWAGPSSAHHATIDESHYVHIYTTKYETTITVYDEAGAVLGALTNEHWD